MSSLKFGVSGIGNRHPAKHLPGDDFNVFLVDSYTLLPVSYLHIFHQFLLEFQCPDFPKQFMGIEFVCR